ncbi:hypothetical protein [Telluribacter sp.]|jgi:hypothetical protein|uniref:hypothetical protein n=1 Tax=Telluribacter sp. TaxID=1978767 RepID=UPI002E13BD60|nr:hypothetical protein [Telluribacter sp.]
MILSYRYLGAFVLLLGLVPTAWAQGTSNIVSFSSGYSVALGKFASEQLNDPEAGLAGPGFFAQLSYERKFLPWLGLRLSGSLNINQTNPDPVIRQYSVLLPQPETYTWTTDVTQWRLGTVMAGPSGYLQVGRVGLEGHAQVGLVLAESPGLNVVGTSSTGRNPVDARVAKSSANALGIGAGASVRIPITERLRFQLTGDWVAASIQLKDVPTYTKVGDNGPFEGLISPKRFVGVLNVGAGLAVTF